MTGQLLSLKPEQLREAPANVRKQFDQAALVELAASITARGIIEPLVVRALPDHVSFEIIAGARRFRAAKLAKLEQLPCVVRDTAAGDVAQDQLVENLQREGITPLEEAQGYAELRRHLSAEEIAQQTGKSGRYVYQRLQLLRLQTSAKAALEKGELSAGVAAEIGRLPQHQQGAFVRSHQYKLAAVTVADARTWIAARSTALTRAPWKLEDGKLVPKAGPCTTCPKNTANEPGADGRTRAACMDPQCWGGKLARFLELTRTALVRNGFKVQLLSGEQYVSKYAWLGDVAQRGPRCPSVKPALAGLLMVGDKAGQVVQLCPGKGCKVHKQAKGAKPSAAAAREQARQRAKIEATRRRNLQRLHWATAVAAKAPLTPDKLGREDLRLIARALLEEEHHEARVAVCRMRGLEPAPGKRQTFDYFRAVARELQRATSLQQLLHFIYQLVLAPAVERTASSSWAVARLEPLAQRLRVRMPKPAPAKAAKRARKAARRK